jgi:flavin-dependent dehydrogenase
VTAGRTTGDRALVRGVVEGGELTIAARMVVEATGRAARCVTQQDATRIAADALVCVWAEVSAHQAGAEAVIETCDQGWWYTVTAAEGRSVVALFTDADLVPPARQRGAWFRELLGRTEHVRQVAGPVPADGALGMCGARTSARRVLWRDTYLAVGDAAWCFDPLAGTGVERAVQNGIDAAKAISRTIGDGDPAPLRAHALATARAFDHHLDVWRRYYAMETRWPDAPFWRRRVAPEPGERR